MKKPLVHLESARCGVRLALTVMQGRMPPNDLVGQLLASGNEHVEFADFPMDLIMAQHTARVDRRRAYAMKSLECLLVKSSDPALMSPDDLRSVVAKAWTIAAAMESEDDVSQQLDTAGKKA